MKPRWPKPTGRFFLYRIQTHEDLLETRSTHQVAEELNELGNACFQNYDGVIATTPAFRHWFMSRPGMSPASRFVVVHEDRIVSSLLLTMIDLQFGGETMKAGAIDGVATHPEHRRRGLARELLDRALSFMEREQADLGFLYTVPDTAPFRFYETAGYRELVRVRYLRHDERQAGAGSVDTDWRIAAPAGAELEAYPALLNRRFSGHWGYPPMTDELWHWRRVARPRQFPVTVYTGDREPDQEGDPQLLFSLGQAPIRKGGTKETLVMLNDVSAPGGLTADAVHAMLAQAPKGVPVIHLCPDTHETDREAFSSAGFRESGLEACLVKPLNNRADRTIRRPPPRWYIVTESVVGV